MAIQERMKKKMEAEAASRQADVDVHLDTRPLDSKGAYSTQHPEDQETAQKTLPGKLCTDWVMAGHKIMLSQRDAQEFSSLYLLLLRAPAEEASWAIFKFSVGQFYRVFGTDPNNFHG